MFSSKIAQIITAILVAASAAIGVPLYQDLKSNIQPPENDIAPTEARETEVKTEMPAENNEQQNSSNYTLKGGVVIEITPGLTNGKISSPLAIKGIVPGSAPKTKFTIRLIDPSGNILSNNSVSASSSGSNGGSTNFSTTLKFNTSNGGTGSLEITSGGSGTGDSITIPVEF